MSKIGILGAGGRLGSRLVHEALTRELHVSALTRHPARLHLANELLDVFKADVEKGEGLDALAGCRWVVSALSSAHPSDCVAHLVRAHSLRKVERLVFVSRADDTVPPHGLSERVSSLVGHRKQDIARDISSALELLQVSGLPYVLLKTTGLTDEPGGKRIVSGEVGKSRPGPIGRVDLARFILDILDAPEWNLREVNVGVA